MSTRTAITVIAYVIIVGMISYGLKIAGEPQTNWLWSAVTEFF